jgi:hypothetical protein
VRDGIAETANGEAKLRIHAASSSLQRFAAVCGGSAPPAQQPLTCNLANPLGAETKPGWVEVGPSTVAPL